MVMNTKPSFYLSLALLGGVALTAQAADAPVLDTPARLLCHASDCSWKEAVKLPTEGGTIELRCRNGLYPRFDEFKFTKTDATNCNDRAGGPSYRVVACRSKEGSAMITNISLHCRMRGE